MATHSSVLAWRIPGTGEPGGLPSMGSHRVGHNWRDSAVAAAELDSLSFIQFVLKTALDSASGGGSYVLWLTPSTHHSSSASILSDQRRYPKLSSCSFSALAPESAFFPLQDILVPFSDKRYLKTPIWVFPLVIVSGYLLFLSLLRGQS